MLALQSGLITCCTSEGAVSLCGAWASLLVALEEELIKVAIEDQGCVCVRVCVCVQRTREMSTV